jgi:hypothetical protein
VIERPAFNPLQAQQVAEAFNAAGVDYLFIGKSGAILLGFPGTTQDVDIFPVANLRDIIASKKASGRMKDRLDLHLLELFRIEYESTDRDLDTVRRRNQAERGSCRLWQAAADGS